MIRVKESIRERRAVRAGPSSERPEGTVEYLEAHAAILNHANPQARKRSVKNGEVMRYFVLWLFGVPYSVIVWLWLLGIC